MSTPTAVRGLGRWTAAGFVGFGALGALIVGWAGTARIDSAVVASATLSVDDDAPPVQHPYGGQVVDVLISDGDVVDVGDVLVTFDTVTVEEERGAGRLEADLLRIRVARLEAQVSDTDSIETPTTLFGAADSAPVVRAIAAANTQLDSWRGVLDSQVQQVRQQPGASAAYQEAQVIAIRAAARLEAEAERSSTLEDLAAVENRLEALTQQLIRAEVTAPSAGVVYGAQRLVAGRVVMAGETMMYVAREPEDLVARARVGPADVAAVTAGGAVRVQLDGLDAQTVPEVSGVITYISPETLIDPTTETSYYAVTVNLDGDDLAALPEDVPLMVGMPATAFLTTGERTVLRYLLEPALDRLDRAMLER